MSLPVIFKPAARLEFEEAVAWYEGESLGLGREFKLEAKLSPSHVTGLKPGVNEMTERGCGRRPSRSAWWFVGGLEMSGVLRLVLRTQPHSANSVTMRFGRSSICRIFLRISRGIMRAEVL